MKPSAWKPGITLCHRLGSTEALPKGGSSPVGSGLSLCCLRFKSFKVLSSQTVPEQTSLGSFLQVVLNIFVRILKPSNMTVIRLIKVIS